MDVPRRHVRRLSVPALTRFRRPNGIRRRRHAIATLKSLNIDEPPLHLAILSHLADLEARLNTSSYALQLLHQLRDEVVALFPTTDEYDFLFSLDLDFDLTGTYAIELSTLSLEEAKKKLSSLSYDDARLRFGALVEGVRQCISFPDLLARLAELRAALPADLSSATDRIVAFVEGLIEDDEDGDISWVDWHHKPKDKVDMHTLALQLSEGGKKLIEYCHLPEKWRNNEFVLGGYRFIPGSQWSTLVLSMFQMHNETVNIHTHFVPFLVILLALVAPWYPFEFGFTPLPPSPADTLPKVLFLLAAGACLACSTIWHTLAGCSDLWLLEGGARIDYVGIGWLISASVSGVMYYGFACQPALMRLYISVAVATGIAGSILPFQGWFNERRNKKWRIAFFVLCACSAVVPLGHMSYIYSFGRMWEFIAPVVPSLASYLAGLVFYATHFPECAFPGWFDWAGSHAIWHVFIVIAVREHWKATAVLHTTSHAFSCVRR